MTRSRLPVWLLIGSLGPGIVDTTEIANFLLLFVTDLDMLTPTSLFKKKKQLFFLVFLHNTSGNVKLAYTFERVSTILLTLYKS